MYYNVYSLSTFIGISLLLYLSLLDRKSRIVTNYELIPLLITCIVNMINQIGSMEVIFDRYYLIFYILGILTIIALYSAGFFGGADLKAFLIILFVINPTKNYGVTPNADGIQIFYYFLISLLFFFLTRTIRNIFIKRLCNYHPNHALNIREILFLYVCNRLQVFYKIKSIEIIILSINSKKTSIQQSINPPFCLLCWETHRVPMIPFITLSWILTTFT